MVVLQVNARPNWDQWALGIAQAVAARADCTRRQVGAVVMAADRRIVGTGYNGAPAGKPGCASAGACPRGQLSYDALPANSPYVGGNVEPKNVCTALHAEENAILHTPLVERAGSTMYVTCAPCPNCARLLAGSGVVRVVWVTDNDKIGELTND